MFPFLWLLYYFFRQVWSPGETGETSATAGDGVEESHQRGKRKTEIMGTKIVIVSILMKFLYQGII